MTAEPALVGAYKFLPLRAKSAYVRVPSGQEYLSVNNTKSSINNNDDNIYASINNIPTQTSTNRHHNFVSKSLINFDTKSTQQDVSNNEYINYQKDSSKSTIIQRPKTSRADLETSQRLIELQNTNLNLKRMLQLMVADPVGTRTKLLQSRPIFRNRVEIPRIRQGRIGSSWRHIKQTNNYNGNNYLFIDGTVRIDDNFKYPPKQYGYPPKIQRLDEEFNGLTTQSLIDLTSPATQHLKNRSPVLNKSSENVYHEHAKHGFQYWFKDSRIPENNKPKAKLYTTGTFKTFYGLSDAPLKL